MILHPPFIITGRLLPGLKIGDGFLSADGAIFYLDTPGFEYEINDFHPGAARNLQDWFPSMLAFMEDAADSRHYRESQGAEFDEDNCDSCENLFPPHVVDWIVANEDDIGCYRMDLDDTAEELIET